MGVVVVLMRYNNKLGPFAVILHRGVLSWQSLRARVLVGMRERLVHTD